MNREDFEKVLALIHSQGLDVEQRRLLLEEVVISYEDEISKGDQ
jgi:hypothetical protein